MPIPPDVHERIRAVLVSRPDLHSLLEAGGLDPKMGLRGADLRHVDFSGDDLSGMDFTKANITGADFSKAIGVDSANFQKAIGRSKAIWPAPPKKTISKKERKPLEAKNKDELQENGDQGYVPPPLPIIEKPEREFLYAIYDVFSGSLKEVVPRQSISQFLKNITADGHAENGAFIAYQPIFTAGLIGNGNISRQKLYNAYGADRAKSNGGLYIRVFNDEKMTRQDVFRYPKLQEIYDFLDGRPVKFQMMNEIAGFIIMFINLIRKVDADIDIEEMQITIEPSCYRLSGRAEMVRRPMFRYDNKWQEKILEEMLDKRKNYTATRTIIEYILRSYKSYRSRLPDYFDISNESAPACVARDSGAFTPSDPQPLGLALRGLPRRR